MTRTIISPISCLVTIEKLAPTRLYRLAVVTKNDGNGKRRKADRHNALYYEYPSHHDIPYGAVA
ncbi:MULTISPECIES: hypothetical protein [Brucella]|uniref:hypothetical protein n=1 Tax=Brucella TaxID=234 RepID=UPI0009726AA4|nr:MULTISPECIES: hypothetical protein [Brucella]APX70866.1 hypothetical protein BKD03_07235 [Brucella sp. 09RB8471]MRN77070.1 hypothetical protein [Brucella sp. 10RB9210]QPN27781.1 hypothetical protein I5770_00065 [Brucella sp. BO2]